MGDNARPLPRLLAVALMSLLAAFTLLVATPALDKGAKAEAMTATEYWTKSDAFIADSRWKNGISWNQIKCKLSPIPIGDAAGCVAYGCDFAYYMYGQKYYKNGTAFYSVSDIRTGDVIRISGHTFVVLERNGGKLRTAEGGFGVQPNQTVRISSSIYTISGNTLYDANLGARTFETGYHFDTGGATTRDGKWWTSETIQNPGSDFYGMLILKQTWVAATVDPSTNYVVNAGAEVAGNTADFRSRIWHFVRLSDGSYKILNTYYDNRPLEASGTSSGDRMVLGSSYTGAAKQKWFVYHASGQYIIRNAASDFVMNVNYAYSTPGEKWQVWTYTDSGAERMSIYKFDAPSAPTLSVSAGTSGSATTLSWTKPASGTVGWYDLKLGRLNADGETYAQLYNQDDLTNKTLSKELTLPAGNYKAWVRAYSVWGGYTLSNTISFTIGEGDTQAPTLSNVKVTEVTDQYVKVTALAEDNVGIQKKYSQDSASWSGLWTWDDLEVGEPGSGQTATWSANTAVQLNNLGDTPQKKVSLEVTFYTQAYYNENGYPTGAGGSTLMKPGHHSMQLAVRDAARNMSERATVEFDIPFADTDTVTLEVGETMAFDTVFDTGQLGTKPPLKDGGQGILDIDADTYEIKGKAAGSCVIVAYNNGWGTQAMKRFVVTEAGSSVNDEAIQQVTEAIAAVNALPAAEDVTLDDQAAIEAARAKYDAVANDAELSALLASLSDGNTEKKLTDAEAALKALQKAAAQEQADREAVQDALAAVNALPAADKVTLDDADAIYAAKDAIDAISDEQMAYVSASEWTAATGKLQAALDKLDKLGEAAIEAAANQLAADNACALVEALPAAGDVKLEDEAAIHEAQTAFEGLTDAQKKLIDAATYTTLQQKLADALDKLDELSAGQGEEDVKAKNEAAANAARGLVEDLPDNIDLANADAVETARDAFYGLTPDQANCINATDYTNLKKKIDDAVAKIATLQKEAEEAAAEKAALDEVRSMINDLPDKDDVRLGDASAINAAEEAYNKLSKEQQDTLGTSLWKKLDAAVDQLAKLQEESAADQTAANDAVALVQALPDADKLKLSDEDAITKAETAFNNLSPEQEELIKPSDYRAAQTKLKQAVQKLAELKAAQTEDPDPEPSGKQAQKITVDANTFYKTYGDKAFSVGAVTNGDGTLKYQSSNTKVATVNDSGQVKICGVGSADIRIDASETSKYKGTYAIVVVNVEKAANGFTAAAKKKTVSVKAAKVKKKAQAIKATTAFKVNNPAGGTVTYKLAQKDKKAKNKITVSSAGKITVKKGLKKGTYTIKVKATCAKANYKTVEKTITLKVKVK